MQVVAQAVEATGGFDFTSGGLSFPYVEALSVEQSG
jgi:hypothetical protein